MGENENKQWTVLDDNSASDSDLWIAYSLLEAGRLWDSRRYQTLGTLLLQRIAREEVADIPGLGPMLLPGKVGFVKDDGWRLNPSYLPPQLLARFAALRGPWQAMQQSNQRLWLETAPHGFSPDWVVWRKTQGWRADAAKPNVGSYDAIRVYLWAGMLADDDAHKAALVRRFQPMAQLTAQQGVPPEKPIPPAVKPAATARWAFPPPCCRCWRTSLRRWRRSDRKLSTTRRATTPTSARR
ncbi:hypothetical protein GGER_01350 [Serratia rubidaea]